jgi:hypothetical protein
VTAYKIGMKVGFEDILDPALPFFRQTKIDVDITQGVNDGGFSFTINVIGRFTQTPGV